MSSAANGDLLNLLDEVAPDDDGTITIRIPFGRHADLQVSVVPRDGDRADRLFRDVERASRFIDAVVEIAEDVLGSDLAGGWAYGVASSLQHGVTLDLEIRGCRAGWSWRGRSGYQADLVSWVRQQARKATGELRSQLRTIADRVEALEVR